MTTAARLATALVALAVVTGGTVGAAAAAEDGSLTANPSEPGETATHTVTVTAGSDTAGSWNGFAVNYTAADADASNVGQEDVVKIGIDRDDDASGDTIDVNVSDDVSSVGASSNGELLTVGLGGSYDVDDGDELVVVYEGVQHPEEAGSYVTPLDVNPQSSGGEATATLTVGSGTSDDTPTTDDAADTTDGDDSDETTSGSSDSDETTSGSSDSDGTTSGSGDGDSGSSGGKAPGFGLTAALFAVGATALLAQRR